MVGEQHIREAVASCGLVEGKDFNITVYSAQGDMPTLLTIFDTAIARGGDLLVPLQPESLQICAAKKTDIPIVFHLAADPFKLKIAKSDTEHQANITGAYVYSDEKGMDEYIQAIKACMPNAKTVGMLHVPGEIVSAEFTDKLIVAAKKIFEVAAVPIYDRASVKLAIEMLLEKKPDAVIAVYASFIDAMPSVLIDACKAKKIPVFGLLEDQVKAGAVAAFTVDFKEGGHEVGKMIYRILKGESPEKIPLFPIKNGVNYVNNEALKYFGIKIPSELGPTQPVD
ncbi:MAG: ABC transporter substrate-binding protein [Candidatus Ozemobacteraceae bacterium]